MNRSAGFSLLVAMGAKGRTAWSMLLDIVSNNLINPFLTGNALQIVFMAAFTGYIILCRVLDRARTVQRQSTE